MHKTIDSAGLLLGKSWKFYKEHWVSLIRLMVGYLILYLVATAVIMGIAFAIAPLTAVVYKGPAALYYIYMFASQILMYVVQIGIGVYFAFSLPKFLHDLDTHKKASVVSALESVIPRFWDFFFITLFFTALLSGGFIALIVPAVYFLFGAMFYPYTATLEHKKGLQALVESYWHTQGKKFGIFLRQLFIGIAILVSVGAVALVVALLAVLIFGFIKLFILKTVLVILLSVAFGLFVFFVVVPFGYIVQYVLYKAVKHTSDEIDPTFSEKKRKLFKVFISIGFVVIVICAAVSVILPRYILRNATPLPAPTADSKTYTNELLMYSVSYPGRYFTRSAVDANPAIFLNLKNDGDRVVIAADDGGVTEKEIMEEIQSDPRAENVKIISRTKIPVDSLIGEDIVITGDFSGIKAKTRAVYVKLADDWTFLFLHTCIAISCDDEGFEKILAGTKFN